VTVLTDGSSITFWGFDALQEIALSSTFQTATFLPLNHFDYILGKGVDSKSLNIFFLTSENYQRVKPILKVLSDSPHHTIVLSNVSSLSYFWFNQSDLPEWVSLVRDDKDVLKNLNEAIQAKDPIAKFSHPDLLWKTTFTDRQILILKGIIHGETNRKIAEMIFQSEKTVEAEIKSICAILDISQKKTEQNIRVLIGLRYAQLVGVL
jgi:DNA-binding CsgD family transcriptional regulator